MDSSTEVSAISREQQNEVSSESNAIDIPYLKNMSLTSPNLVFGLSLGFIAILWLILAVAPFGNIQLMVQILAAYSSGMIVAFVLTFFMTLLAGILNSKYSPRLVDIVFSRWTIGYMFLFVASTVFALMCIKGNVVERDIRLGFGLLSTCFFLLIPYIIFIKEYLKPEQFIRNMSRLALSKIRLLGSDLDSLPEEINQIDYLIISSQQLDDYDTFEKGLAELAWLSEQIPYEAGKRQIVLRLESIARSFISKPHAPVIVLRYLHQFGISAIRSSRYGILSDINQAITDIGEDAIKAHSTFTVNEIINILNQFGKEISGKKDWTTVTKQILRNLGNLGDQCLKRKMPVSAESIAKGLGEFGEILGQSADFEELTYETVNLLKSLAHTAKLAEYDEVRREIVLSLGNIGKVTTAQPGLKELTTYIISAWEQSSEGLEM